MPEQTGSGRRALVSGGAGFLGSRVVHQLLDRGWTVTVLDNLSNSSSVGRPVERDSRTDLVTVDLRDSEGVLEGVRRSDPELVVHLAALHFIPACVRMPTTTLEINVIGTQHLLDACMALGTKPRLVLASTADVYTPSPTPHDENSEVGPDNVYGLSKLTAEGLVRFAGRQGACDPLVCRLFNLYGPGETNPHVIPAILEQLHHGDVLRLGNTTPKRDFVYVDDAADAIVRLSEVAPAYSTVNVGTGRSYSVDEVVARLRALTGRELRVEVDPERWRKSDRPNLAADNHLLRSFVPDAVPTALESGLRQLLAHEGLAAGAL